MTPRFMHLVSAAALFLVAFASTTRDALAFQVFPQVVNPHCVDFDDLSLNGWNTGGSAVTLSINNPGPSGSTTDSYLRAQDQSGASSVHIGVDFLGDYSHVVESGCAALSFDVRLYNDGDGSQSTALHPSVTFKSGALTATFVSTLTMTEDAGTSPGWHHVCAPLWITTGSQLPSSQAGAWSGVTPAQWNTLLAHVTDIVFPIDFTSNPAEVVGYDNVCLEPDTGCRSGINKDIINQTGQVAYGVEILVAGIHPVANAVFNGPFSRFDVIPAGANTIVRWTDNTPGAAPCDCAVMPGMLTHVGFVIPKAEITILGIQWLDCLGHPMGCIPQVSAPDQQPTQPAPHILDGVVTFANTAIDCSATTKYVTFKQIEWGSAEEHLDDLVTTGVRTPIAIEVLNDAPVAITPNGEYTRLVSPPPADADWATLVFQVSDSATGTPGVTDWIQVRVLRPPTSSPSTPFCFGDGSGAACPCGNPGTAGHGCANSAFAGGAVLTSSGFASLSTDTLVLTASDVTGPGLFFQANGVAANPLPFGDGLLCATVGIKRLGVVFPVGGVASFPGGISPAPISIAGAPINPGDVKHYQCWYRNSAAFCTSDTYNLTQGLSLTFTP